jgi:hypothetical protein
MRGADQRPLAFYLFHPAQQKLPEPARLFYLPENGLNYLLALCVDRMPYFCLQLAPHPVSY